MLESLLFWLLRCPGTDHGHQSLADLLIHAIQSAAAWAYGDQLVEQTGAAGLVSRHLLQPLGQRARQMGTEQPQRGQRQQRGQRGGEQQQEWLPPPFQEGVRDDFPPALCMLGVSERAAAAAVPCLWPRCALMCVATYSQTASKPAS